MKLHHHFRIVLISTVGTIALTVPAAAQTSQEVAQTTDTVPPSTTSAAAGPEDVAGGDIVVTATRQSEQLSRVPISISAFSQDSMNKAGVRAISDVARITPGLTLNNDNNFVAIRGISSSVGAGTTGIYIDDTPIQVRGVGAFPQNSALVVFDLDRIEVLRGPQGTLFGAGSEGGTLRYITPQPNLDGLGVYSRTEGSGTQGGAANYEAGVAVGGPIQGDRIGFRISGYHRFDDGYIDLVNRRDGSLVDRNINSTRATAFQAALTAKLGEDIQVTPSVYYQKRTADAPNTMWAGFSDLDSGRLRAAWNVPVGAADRFVLPALKVEMSLGAAAQIITNTSYFSRNEHHTQDFSNYTGGIFGVTTPTGPIFPGVPNLTETDRATTTQRNWTQEIRLQSSNPGSRLSFVVGAFFSRAEQYNQELVLNPSINAYIAGLFPGATATDIFGVPAPNDVGVDARITTVDRQFAVFSDATFAFTPKLKLTVGGRYSRTKFHYDNFQYGPYNGGVTTGNGSSKQNPFTPKVSVQYQADPSNLIYATASKGFRIGGANKPVSVTCNDELAGLGLSRVPDTYNGDSVWSYEVGAKNKLFNGALQIASSAFQIDWKDIQQNVSLSGCGWNYIANTGSARSRGVDLQAQLRVVPGFILSGTLGYTDVRFTKNIVNQGTLLSGNPARVNYIVRKDDKLEIPPWTASFALDYNFTAVGRPAYFRGDYQYQARVSRRVTDLNPINGSYDPDYTPLQESNFTKARLGARLGAADVSLFVDNVLNSHAELTRTHTQRRNQVYYLTTFRPRTFGATLIYRH